ncbi:PLC-like phosphodiesterase [Syncephalis fuscata]|nr:PLC-like phosphodiesterase [Syncephalis fuscata]
MRDLPEMDAPTRLRAFSIVYLKGSRYESLHIIPTTSDVQVDWLTGLQILAHRYCHQHHDDETTTLKEQENVWLGRQWKLADKDNNEKLSLSEFTRICQQMNMALSQKELKLRFVEVAGNKENEIEYEAFISLVQSLKVRHDLVDIFYLYSRDYNQEDVTRPANESIICAITFESFTRFLQSEDNPVNLEVNKGIWQNMKFPLCHYFIHSSHNTYLIGNQLTGKSSVDAYVFALEHGCRCVELDCWDGPDGEPIVYHGYTLTTKISFQEIITVIKKHAFDRSPFPLILSLEVHCKLLHKNTLGDMLVTEFLTPNETVLPSPHDLMYRILIKTKGLGEADSFTLKRSTTIMVTEPTLEDIADPLDEEKLEQVKPVKFASSLAALAVYCQTKHFVSFGHSQANDAIYEMCSFAESTNVALAKKSPAAAIRHNKKHLSRIYPSGKRINSTNYEPVVHWGVGSQLVALNLQTYDASVQLNRAMFRQNGQCGYVLKPPHLYLPSSISGPNLGQRTLRVKIISGQQLPKPKNSEGGDGVDPYCIVQLISPTGTQKYSTNYVYDNGFDPIWNEQFSLKVENLELAFLRFSVWTKKLTKANLFLASFCVVLSNLHSGYKHVPLRDYKGNPLLGSTLFVYTELSR